ncbi:MAG: hypothetical protein FWC27_04515 [Firmicutes bacterium]|nr:hypothetical protein [Bacillota bacterium]
MEKLKSVWSAIIHNKRFCLAWLVFGCAYVTFFGFLYVEDPFTQGLRSVNVLGILLEPTMRATASVIGKTYFWGFKGWGLFQTISLALNTLYMYRRYGFTGKSARFGKICLIIAACCITACVIIPSTEEFGLQLVAHWSGALLFGVFNAIAIGLCLLRLSKQSRKFLTTFIVFLAMLGAMIALLAVFGKSGAIESIPMWGAYLILLAANYTGLYRESLPGRS